MEEHYDKMRVEIDLSTEYLLKRVHDLRETLLEKLQKHREHSLKRLQEPSEAYFKLREQLNTKGIHSLTKL